MDKEVRLMNAKERTMYLNRIAELEQENVRLKSKCEETCEYYKNLAESAQKAKRRALDSQRMKRDTAFTWFFLMAMITTLIISFLHVLTWYVNGLS